MFQSQNALLQPECGNNYDLANIEKWKGILLASLKKVSRWENYWKILYNII